MLALTPSDTYLPSRSRGGAQQRPVPKMPRAHGAVAQLGERYNGIVEVWGSIPHGSTNIFKGLAGNGWALFNSSPLYPHQTTA